MGHPTYIDNETEIIDVSHISGFNPHGIMDLRSPWSPRLVNANAQCSKQSIHLNS